MNRYLPKTEEQRRRQSCQVPQHRPPRVECLPVLLSPQAVSHRFGLATTTVAILWSYLLWGLACTGHRRDTDMS